MLINTTRFGKVEVEESRVITFPKGLLGFPSFKHYVLLENGEESYFWWLQSTQAPELAFVVTDPSLFVSTYRVPVKEDQMREMGLEALSQAQVLVIVNKHGELLTGNLQGPLIINCRSRTGEQLVLSDRRFSTRVPLVEVGAALEAIPA